jgi:hypothetical protein
VQRTQRHARVNAARAAAQEGAGGLGLVNLVDRDVPAEERWTTSHKEPGEARQCEQIDLVLVPGWAKDKVSRMRIDRRTTGKAQPDGSDRDPIYCAVTS